tara:strand:+ start:1135 stop:1311 length:177 start_codon:yes stop_codon:yes gene_type:complete
VGGDPEPPGAPSHRPKLFNLGAAAVQELFPQVFKKLVDAGVFANKAVVAPVLNLDVCI